VSAAWLAAITTAIVAGMTGAAWVAHRAWRLMRGTARFLDEWGGEVAHNGAEVRPGVMARLKALEDLLAKVAQETRPNGGSSMRDVVARTAADVADIKHEQAAMRARMELLESQRAGREEKRP
jgi:hypothetical protein